MATKTEKSKSGVKPNLVKNKLREIGLTEGQAMLLLFLNGLTESSWESISKSYFNGKSLEDTKKYYLYQEGVQNGYKYLLSVIHKNKLIELYNIYFERAKEDTNAFNAFVKFSETFFKDEQELELTSLLNNIDIGDEDE